MCRKLHSSLLFVALLLATACQAPPQEAVEEETPTRTTEQVMSEFDALRAEWQARANAGDPAGVAAFYTQDAVLNDPWGNVHEGHEAILGYLEGSFAEANDLTIATAGVLHHGDMVVGYGTWSQTVPGPTGEMTLAGTWQTVAMYQPDGSPKILLHQSMIPAEPPPSG